MRRRLDVELVRRGLASGRGPARELIDQGAVHVNGAVAGKASRLVDPADAIVLRGEAPRFVSRAGRKLDAALDHFAIEVTGRTCLDAGASTGGFTDCLLQRGARHVTAVDVGHGQLHESLRADPRVQSIERTNIRNLGPADIGGPVDLLVADLSFISLRTVMAALVGLTRPGADLVLLVKPQFEAGRAEASRGRGVVSDPDVWLRVLEEVAAAATEAGAPVRAAVASPITGASGNVEFLAHLVRGGGARPFDPAAVVASLSVPGS